MILGWVKIVVDKRSVLTRIAFPRLIRSRGLFSDLLNPDIAAKVRWLPMHLAVVG